MTAIINKQKQKFYPLINRHQKRKNLWKTTISVEKGVEKDIFFI